MAGAPSRSGISPPNSSVRGHWGEVVFPSAVFTHFLQHYPPAYGQSRQEKMEPNRTLNAHAGAGHDRAPVLEPGQRAEPPGDRTGNQSGRPDRGRWLFVHENCGDFGGAETNIFLAATELRSRGYSLGLLYEQGTGRNQAQWRQLFSPCHPLRGGSPQEALSHLRQFRPEMIYLHKLADLEVLEALLHTGLPVVRMVHDHSLTCLREYKYNYFTRAICRRPASGYCVFPCLASLARNRQGPWPVRWASYRRKQQEISLTKRCARVVVYSQYQREELERNGFDPAKIEICVPIRAARPPQERAASRSGNQLLYVGQIIRGKGVDVLLEALAKVKVPFRCNLVGEGSHRHYCERRCARLGLEKTVRFCGYVPPAQLERFYREASVFVMSSLWPEPFGMAGPEAMAYGLPVVAFDAGGIREWLCDGQNGCLVPWKDTDAFAARVEELLLRPGRARQLGQNGKEWVRRYDSSRQIDRLENLFRELIHPLSKSASLGHNLVEGLIRL